MAVVNDLNKTNPPVNLSNEIPKFSPPKNSQTKELKQKTKQSYVIGFFVTLLLIVGVGVGVYLIQNQQVFKSKASGCEILWDPGLTGPFTVPTGCQIDGFRIHKKSVPAGTTDSQCIGTSQWPEPSAIILSGGTYNPRQWGDFCQQCVQVDNVIHGGGSAQYTGDCPVSTPAPTKSPSPTSEPTITPEPTDIPQPTMTPQSTFTPSPTTEPTISAQCVVIRIYNTDWQLLEPNDLQQIKPGDKIYLAVLGEASDQGITMARFSINGTVRNPVTQKRSSTNEFYELVEVPQIPENQSTLQINIKANLYHPSFGWF